MNFELVILDGPQAGRRLPVGNDALTFGRAEAASLPFPQDSFLSSNHLSLQAGPEGVLLTDLHSTNGTFLNGERIIQALARPGDIIQAGTLSLQVALAQPPAAAPAILRFPGNPTLERVMQLLTAGDLPLYCLLDAAVNPAIERVLLNARIDPMAHSLYSGESAATLANWAPYLLPLSPASALLPVLLERGWGKSWASYFTSAAPFDELRKHFRKFLMVQVEGRGEVYFRFYDPRVLRDFLPTATPGELLTFFGPVREWSLEGEAPGTLLRMSNSPTGLRTDLVTCE